MTNLVENKSVATNVKCIPSPMVGCNGYNTLLDRMKQSVYNIICWNQVDSETDLRQRQNPRDNTANYLSNTDAIYSVVKKCGDYLLKETQARSNSLRCPPYDRIADARDNLKKSFCKASGEPKFVEPQEDLKKSTCRQRNTNRVLSNVLLHKHNINPGESKKNEEHSRCKTNTEGAYTRNDIGRIRASKHCEKDMGSICLTSKHRGIECGGLINDGKRKEKRLYELGEEEEKDRKLPFTKNTIDRMNRLEKRNQIVCYNYRGDGKKRKQIYKLSEEQCRSFKEKGYVKVNVLPNVSVSDFDIVIRKDHCKTDLKYRDV